MTKAILYLLLFAYSVNLVKPVLPYIKDTVSHIFWYSKHLSTVHIENGKYHVHVEAMAIAKKSDLPVSESNVTTEKGLSEHFTSSYEYHFPHKPFADLVYPQLIIPLPSCFMGGNYPPPRL